MAGGILKALGITLIVLGALSLVGGMAVSTLGASVYAGEESKEPTLLGGGPDREREQAGVAAAVGGLGLAGVGLVVVILGIVLLLWGISKARRASMIVDHRPGA